MIARREVRDESLWPWIASMVRHLLPPFGLGAVVLSLVILVGSYVSLTANAVAQNTVEEWTSADGRTRMMALWYPKKIRVWRDSSTEYEISTSKSGDILIRFKEGDTGTTGLYSLSQNKLLSFTDSRWSAVRFELKISEHGLSSIYPHLEDYSDVVQEYLIDLTFEGFHSCDPHAAAIYPTKHFNQKEFGRVLVRINNIPRITTSDKYCEAWAEEREQLLFVEAVAPEIYRLPSGGLLLADPNYPIVFVNDDARNVADLSFCIGSPYFTYVMLDAAMFSEIIEKVERQYQFRRNHDAYSHYFYANTVRKNIDLMDEVGSLIGDCPEWTVRERTPD